MQRQKPKGPGKPGSRFKPGSGTFKGAGGGRKSGDNSQKRPRQEINKSRLAATEAEIQDLKTKYAEIDATAIKKFAQFPLSKKTQRHWRSPNSCIPRRCSGTALDPHCRARMCWARPSQAVARHWPFSYP